MPLFRVTEVVEYETMATDEAEAVRLITDDQDRDDLVTAVIDRTAERIDAEERAGYWLSRGNQAAERGKYELAERHYVRAQKWQDKMNELLGNA